MSKIDIENFTNNKELYEIGGKYYSNGDFIIKKELCKTPKCKVKKHPTFSLDRVLEVHKYSQYKEADEAQVQLIISEVHVDLICFIETIEGVKAFIAGRSDPLKYMLGDEIVALVMPCRKPLNQEQLNILMMNDFGAYCDHLGLIPVEYKTQGEEGCRGIFVSKLFSDTQIKRIIFSQVKHTGGLWLGKFERKPELLEHYVDLMKPKFNELDKSKIISKMNGVLNAR